MDVADGRLGYPSRAPYDRIIATCGLDRVPAAWLQQVQTGGKILVNLSFALILLTVADDGTATGQFGETAAFMAMRDDPTDVAANTADVLATCLDDSSETAWLAPWHEHATAEPVAFLRKLQMPSVKVVTLHAPDGEQLLLVDPNTDSWARARRADGGAELVEHGPRRLYAELGAIVAEWDQHGRPNPDRYGLTVTADGQHTLWLDEPSTAVAAL